MATDDRALRRTREAVLTGRPAPSSAPRPTIAASWRRVSAVGLDPGSGADVPPLGEAELARRRAASGLAEFVPQLTASLQAVIDAGQLVVVADADGWVLWRAGGSGVRRLADDLGFVGGSAWTEGNVGTNAIGTALVLGEGVHVQGPEHFVESHTRWGCAATPLTDPWSGRTLGVLDVSGPSRGMHPAELALVEAVARLTSLEIVTRRRTELDGLRARAAPILARISGDALAVDAYGHLAAAVGGTGARARRAARRPRRRGRCGCPRSAAPRPSRWRAGGCCGSTATTYRPPPGPCSTSPGHRACRSSRRAAAGRAGSRRGTPRSCSPSATPVRRADGRRARPRPVRRPVAHRHRPRRDVTAAPDGRQPAAVEPLPVLAGACRSPRSFPADRTAVLPGSSAPVVRRLR